MTTKYKGSRNDLSRALTEAAVDGTWSENGKGLHSFRSVDGGIINFWPSTRTIQFQGVVAEQQRLKDLVFPSGDPDRSIPRKAASGGRQIFIVHGHDMEARDQLELALHRLGLEPYVLMNSGGGGMTIIEALEGKIGRDHSSDFGIMLMTPNDFGYAKDEKPEDAQPRARQNVILETGMLLASLTRVRMAIVVKGIVEIPSDMDGIIRIGYNRHIREAVPKLCQRLKQAGFDLDPSQIANAAQ